MGLIYLAVYLHEGKKDYKGMASVSLLTLKDKRKEAVLS